MPAEPMLQIVGARQLRDAMKQAGVSLDDLKPVNARAAQIVQAAAASRAPRRSGRLAGSLRSSGTRRAGVVRAGGARVPYANPIHWGWPRRHIAANTFVVDAAQATEPAWVEVYAHDIEQLLEQIAGQVQYG